MVELVERLETATERMAAFKEERMLSVREMIRCSKAVALELSAATDKESDCRSQEISVLDCTTVP